MVRILHFYILNQIYKELSVHKKNINLFRSGAGFLILLLLVVPVFFNSCAGGAGGSKVIGPNTIRVHYIRKDNNYENMTLWIWEDTTWKATKGWPNGMAWTGRSKDGVFFDVPLKPGAQKLGFLAVDRTKGDGGKDGGDKKFAMLSQFKQVWIRQGDDGVYISRTWAKPVGIVSATLTSSKTLDAVFITTAGLTQAALKKGIAVKDSKGAPVVIKSVKKGTDGKTVVISLDVDIRKAPYKVIFDKRSVMAKAGWRYVDGVFAYKGWLGPRLLRGGRAMLKMWSPLVASVKVIIYDKRNHDRVVKDNIPMKRGKNGVWSVILSRANTGLANLRGYYYNYKVDANGDGKTRLALDPYAPSMAPYHEKKYAIGRGAIVNPNNIGPRLRYARIRGYRRPTDAVIYEAHVRDMTSDPKLEGKLKAPFGTFLALIEKLDYIKSLGVTHVQLLPVMSYKHGNELGSRKREMNFSTKNQNYNWGYDPHSYFSVSGMYSVKPRDPEKRIAELKTLIKAIHARGMGVILDVVYNHTADVRIFEDLAPGYYHFMSKDGKPKTSFGGGRLGTTHAMSRRILVDSILYWTKVFKVDGFRFDMMGDHDAASIQRAWDEAKKLNPNILMVGEGWRTYSGDDGDKRKAADQDWMASTDSVAVFSDEFRNELKSGFGCEGQPRFLTGGARSIKQIFNNIKAQPHNYKPDNPRDVMPYIAAHDNLTLHDVIAHSAKIDPDTAAGHKEIHRRIRIGNAMVLTSQGVAFIHAGQEYGRTKQWRTSGKPEHKGTKMVDKNGKPFKFPWFVHDSYDSSDIINRFDWSKALDAGKNPVNVQTRHYTAGLIKLRRSTDAFRLGSKTLINRNVKLLSAPEIKSSDLAIAYSSKSRYRGTYYVFVNADNKARTLTIGKDLRRGKVLVDEKQAGTSTIRKPSGFTLSAKGISMKPLTVVVIRM